MDGLHIIFMFFMVKKTTIGGKAADPSKFDIPCSIFDIQYHPSSPPFQ